MTLEQAAQDLLEILHDMLYTNSFGGFQCTRDDAGDIGAAIDALGKALAQPVTQAVPQIPQTDSSNKQWIALTDEEIDQLSIDAGIITWIKRVYDDVDKKFYDLPLGEGMEGDGISLKQFANLVSTRLKEKNT